MDLQAITLFLCFTKIFGQQIEQSLLIGNNLFSASVYREVIKNGEFNTLVSPLSAKTAIAMLFSGASGETEAELRESLNVDAKNYFVAKFTASLSISARNELRSLNLGQKTLEYDLENLMWLLDSEQFRSFRISTKMFLQKCICIKKDFLQIARGYFHTDLENIHLGPQSADIVNRWVEEQTENKVHGVIYPDTLDENTVSVLVNVLYFKENWAIPFKHSPTINYFYRIDKRVIPVSTMVLYDPTFPFNYAENNELGAQFLEIPFKTFNISMIFVLPYDINGIFNLENQINQVLLPQIFMPAFVNISLPKFKIENEIDFQNVLVNLGVSKAFIPEEADFSKISDRELFIDRFFQKNYISVDENGVDGAPPSYINHLPEPWSHPLNEPRQFNADHPFLYYIKVNELVVFIGRVGAPTYWKYKYP